MKFFIPIAFYGVMLFGRQAAAGFYLVLLGDLSFSGLLMAMLESLPK